MLALRGQPGVVVDVFRMLTWALVSRLHPYGREAAVVGSFTGQPGLSEAVMWHVGASTGERGAVWVQRGQEWAMVGVCCVLTVPQYLVCVRVAEKLRSRGV